MTTAVHFLVVRMIRLVVVADWLQFRQRKRVVLGPVRRTCITTVIHRLQVTC